MVYIQLGSCFITLNFELKKILFFMIAKFRCQYLANGSELFNFSLQSTENHWFTDNFPDNFWV